MTAQRYLDQVALLLRTIPEIASEPDFALKGGTAINLFARDLPRLSVDIDLVYLPVADRTTSLDAVRTGLERIARCLETRLGFKVERHLLPDGKRLLVHSDSTAIKVEVSPVLRGTVFPPEMRTVSPGVEDRLASPRCKSSRWPTSTPARWRPRSIASIRATGSTSTISSPKRGSTTICSAPS